MPQNCPRQPNTIRLTKSLLRSFSSVRYFEYAYPVLTVQLLVIGLPATSMSYIRQWTTFHNRWRHVLPQPVQKFATVIMKINTLTARSNYATKIVLCDVKTRTFVSDTLFLWRWTSKLIYVFLLTVHLGIILVNDQLDAQFLFSYMFIPNFYMFRALVCSSSGELIVPIRDLVCVTLCRWPSGMQVWVEPKPAHQTVTYIEWHIPDVVLIQLILLMMSTRVLETCRDLE
jgi:hypothetical protein